jgi:hypothetical protein
VYAGRVRAALVAFGAMAGSLLSHRADARNRPLFEPTDLEMEKTGIMELDVQVGAVRGDAPWRAVVPDVEVDIGVAPNVELDVDGAYAIEGPGDGRFSFDHPAPDNLWIAAKLGLFDSRDVDKATAWAVGAQLGPKLPLANDAHGIGYEALLLVGRTWSESHLVLNVGGLVDPGGQISAQRPIAVEGGVDLDLHFGSSPFSVTGELAGVHFFSDDEDQINVTAGVTFGASDNLDLSLIALAGLLAGDRAGVLLGVSPKFALFK